MEHVRDVVNKFLGQAHAPVVDGGGDQYEVDMFLRLSFLDDGFGSWTKCLGWSSLSAVLRNPWCSDYSQRSTISDLGWSGLERNMSGETVMALIASVALALDGRQPSPIFLPNPVPAVLPPTMKLVSRFHRPSPITYPATCKFILECRQ